MVDRYVLPHVYLRWSLLSPSSLTQYSMMARIIYFICLSSSNWKYYSLGVFRVWPWTIFFSLCFSMLCLWSHSYRISSEEIKEFWHPNRMLLIHSFHYFILPCTTAIAIYRGSYCETFSLRTLERLIFCKGRLLLENFCARVYCIHNTDINKFLWLTT